MSDVIIACPSSVCALSVNIGGGASLSKEATLSASVCEQTRRRDCVKLESRNPQGTWYEGTWNDWSWKTPDHWSSSSSSTPQACSWTWHNWEHHSPWSKQAMDTTSNDPRQYGDGRGEVIPTFDGADFRQYERRVRLCVQYTSGPREKGLVNFWSDCKDEHPTRLKEYRTWKHRMLLRICCRSSKRSFHDSLIGLVSGS